MKAKTQSNVERVPVASKVLRNSDRAATGCVADRSAYKRYASESREGLVKSADKRAAEMAKKD